MEGQSNYGDAQYNHPKSKRQHLNPPNHQSNSKRQNLGVETTQQLASKKHFADKRNQFNLTSLKGNKIPGNQETSDYQHGNDSVNKPIQSITLQEWNKTPTRNNFQGQLEHNQNMQTSEEGYRQDHLSIDGKPNTNQYQKVQGDALDELIKLLYNESLKRKRSGKRNFNSLNRFDAREVKIGVGRFRGRESENGSKYARGDTNRDHNFGVGDVERGGWNVNEYTERGDRYGSRELEMDSRQGGRDMQGGGRYGGRHTDDRFGGRNKEVSDRSGNRELVSEEGRFDNREPRRDDRFGKFVQENNKRETAYYDIEKGQEQGRDRGIQKQGYPVKGNRNTEYPDTINKNVEYPNKGNRNGSYRNDQEFSHVDEQYSHSEASGQQVYFNENLAAGRGYMNQYDRTVSNYNNPASRRNITGGNDVFRTSKNDHKKGSKGDIKQILIDAGNQSVLNYRKRHTETPLISDLKTGTTIASHLPNSALNPLINPVSMVPPLRVVPPLHYIPPGAVPAPTPNMPLILRYNAMPTPLLQHPILNNITIPRNQVPTYFSNQPLPHSIVHTNIQSSQCILPKSISQGKGSDESDESATNEFKYA